MSRELFRKCVKCGAIPLQDDTISFHRFPKPGKTNILRARAWAVYCWPDKNWSSLDSITQLYKTHKMICGRHFGESSFLDSTKRRLFKFSVPGTSDYVKELMSTLRNEETLQNTDPKIIEESESGIPTTNETGSSINLVLQDHTYHLDADLDISKCLGVQSEELNSSVSGCFAEQVTINDPETVESQTAPSTLGLQLSDHDYCTKKEIVLSHVRQRRLISGAL